MKMQFRIEPEVFERFPTFCVGVVVATGLDNGGQTLADARIKDELRAEWRRARDAYAGRDLKADPAIAVWRDAFAKAGFDPDQTPSSVEALMRRPILSQEEAPTVNDAVDLGNIVSLRHRVPVGAHDLDRLRGDFVVRVTREGDAFTLLGAKESESVPAGEIAYADDVEVRTRRWVWRLGEKGKVTPRSGNVIFPIDGFVGQTDEQVRRAVADLKVKLQEELGAAVVTGFVDAAHPAMDLPEWSPVAVDPIERLLTRNVVEVLPSRDEMEKVLRSGKKLRIYLGVDATSPVIHIGHSVQIQKLREFQDLGHKVVLLIGDFTGRIGDPTDKSAARSQLTPEMVKENAKTYVQQVSKILDFNRPDNPVELRFNGDWWDKMTAKDMIELAAYFTVQQMLQRDMFQKRLAENRPIGLHEFLYPLLQGFDSVSMDVDAELGGTDQTFNMLAGRTLVKAINDKEKFVLTGPLLEGTDGRKMSKSYGNVIGVNDEPYEMYGKLMSVKDELITKYFELVTDFDEREIETMVRDLAAGAVNPMVLKKRLAANIVTRLHSAEAAAEAAARFEREVQRHELPAEIPDVVLPRGGDWPSVDLLVACKLATGKNDAKRLVEGGGVEYDGAKVTEARATIAVRDGAVLRGRRRQFARLRVGE
jgi:tyrosyl-tRNA synthetase